MQALNKKKHVKTTIEYIIYRSLGTGGVIYLKKEGESPDRVWTSIRSEAKGFLDAGEAQRTAEKNNAKFTKR